MRKQEASPFVPCGETPQKNKGESDQLWLAALAMFAAMAS